MTRRQFKLMDRIARLMRRADWGVDDFDLIVELVVLTELQLNAAGLTPEPTAFEWLCVGAPFSHERTHRTEPGT